jgi:hypothetical protein
VQDAQSAGKKVLLIIKYNNVPDLVLLADLLPQGNLILHYKGFNLYKLDNLMQQPDTYFFD